MLGAPAVSGGPAIDPDMLLALLIYSYATGQRSSRQIERLCADHVAYRVLCAQDAPDHTTIARFRADHDEAFIDVFAQVLRLCSQAGMVRVGTIAIDGTKIAANASRSANRSQQWVAEQARRLAEAAVAEAAAVDAAEDAAEDAAGGPAAGPPAELGTPAGRAAAIKKAMEEIARQDAGHAEADAADAAAPRAVSGRGSRPGKIVVGPPPAGVDQVRLHQARITREQQRLAPLLGVRGTADAQQRAQSAGPSERPRPACSALSRTRPPGSTDRRGSAARIRARDQARRGPAGGPLVNLTDPQARLMVEGSGGGSVQGYNSQIACSDDHLVIGVHVSQDANDLHCWTPTLAAATTQTDALGKTIGLVLADNGYFTEANLTSPGPDRLIAPGSRPTKSTTTPHTTRPTARHQRTLTERRDAPHPTKPRSDAAIQTPLGDRGTRHRTPQGPNRPTPLRPTRTHRRHRRTPPRRRSTQHHPTPPRHRRITRAGTEPHRIRSPQRPTHHFATATSRDCACTNR